MLGSAHGGTQSTGVCVGCSHHGWADKPLVGLPIEAGWKGPEAAGVIHTDFNKGFIRAEVYSVDDLDELGSEAAIKAAGRMRTEGRDYALAEGDVCHFLIGR